MKIHPMPPIKTELFRGGGATVRAHNETRRQEAIARAREGGGLNVRFPSFKTEQQKNYLSAKYYLVDIGLRYFLLGSKKADMGRILENVIYLELLRRGYEVYIGKVGTLEVDFVAVKSGDVEYYQVAQTVQVPETWEREIKPLESIKDHNPKFLLTLDNEPVSSHKGIKQIYALDWLLG